MITGRFYWSKYVHIFYRENGRIGSWLFGFASCRVVEAHAVGYSGAYTRRGSRGLTSFWVEESDGPVETV